MIVAIAGFLFWAWMDRNAKREAAQQPVAVEGPAATAAADSEIAAAAPNPPPATASASPEEGAPGTTGTTAVPEVAAPPGADTTGLVRRAATSAGQQPALAGVDRTSPGAVSPPATAGGAPTTTRQDTSLSQSHRAASEGSATVEPGPRVTPPASPEVAPPPAREVSKPAVREAPPAAADSEFWSVWVSSYKTEKRANVELQFLHRHGYEGRAVLTDLGPDKGMWYRIYAGRYQTRAEAEAARVRLARLPQFADFTWVRRLPRD
jgi:cell division septation protein DedD